MTRAPTLITPSYALAMACGADAAQRQATLAGRAAWSEADFNLAAKVANDVCLAAGLITREQHRELTS